MSREPLKWHDRNAKDNSPFLDALAKVRDMGVHEGWCYRRQSILRLKNLDTRLCDDIKKITWWNWRKKRMAR
jgi:hypothetical protein